MKNTSEGHDYQFVDQVNLFLKKLKNGKFDRTQSKEDDITKTIDLSLYKQTIDNNMSIAQFMAKTIQDNGNTLLIKRNESNKNNGTNDLAEVRLDINQR